MTAEDPLPKLPDVRDEAADTPAWLSWVGLGLLAVGVIAVLVASQAGGTERDESGPSEIRVEVK